MSIIKALQQYIKQYGQIDFTAIHDLDESRNSYAMYPTSGGDIRVDVCGMKTYSRDYIFLAKRLDVVAQEHPDYDFIEGFCDWLEEKTDNNQYPNLGNGIAIESITVKDIALLNTADGFDKGTYRVQINLTYKKGEI